MTAREAPLIKHSFYVDAYRASDLIIPV